MSIYQVLVITEKELDEAAVAKPDEKGMPRYACVTKAGTLRFWPKFDPVNHILLLREA